METPGVICEFGVHWGATLAELINLRGIYEPFNSSRTIIGFDTFEGFLPPSHNDGGNSSAGDYSSVEGFEKILDEVLSLHESFSPLNHNKKFELVKGDAAVTIDAWLEENPHAIIAMAIFDMDLFDPTVSVLKKIIPRLTKGSILVFDELNCKAFPGETLALDKVMGLNNIKLHKSKLQPYASWIEYGEI